MNPKPSRTPPWYREPLVWLVLAIPATAVLGGVVMLVLANATWDGLVADDYYRQGMQINRSLARDAEAARLGLRATLAFPAPGIVEARLAGTPRLAGTHGTAASDEARLDLHFARAARAGADVRVPMTRNAAGVWRGVLPALPPGKWYVQLGAKQRRLAAPAQLPASSGELALRAPGTLDQ